MNNRNEINKNFDGYIRVIPKVKILKNNDRINRGIGKKLLLLSFICLVSCAVFIGLNTNRTTAYAAPMRYVTQGKIAWSGNQAAGGGSGSYNYADSNDNNYYEVYMYSKRYTDSAKVQQDKVFNISTFTIVASTLKIQCPKSSSHVLNSFSFTLFCMDKSKSIASNFTLSTSVTNQTLYSGDLSNGYYRLRLNYFYSSLNSGQYTYNYDYFFYVDTSPPVNSIKAGDTEVASGSYTSSKITYSSSDLRLSKIYYKSPNMSSFSTTTAVSYNVSATTANNGWWYFYATDTSNYTSETVSIYIDTVAPNGTISSGGVTVASGGYTSKSFLYSATDSGGVKSLQYKIPSSTVWLDYTGTAISASATNGRYFFRAMDNAGQYSSESSVYLDTVAPSCSLYAGLQTVSSGAVVNSNYIMFSVVDFSSSTVLVKTPGASAYVIGSSGTQYTTSGTYMFYALDSAGNTSATYTITLDKILPTLTCSGANFNSISGKGFTVNAMDNNGSVKLYYRLPDTTAFEYVGSSSITIDITRASGKYYFYAEDSAGNLSETVWIDLKVVYPVAQIIRSDKDNTVFVTWEGNNYAVTLNGLPYIKDTVIKQEGSYSVVVTDKLGIPTNYSFSIQHKYILAVTAPTCTEKGYTFNDCISCEHSYYSYYIEAIGHNYVESVITPSCTEGGCVRNICLNCANTYETESVLALGHRYLEKTVLVTCTQNGYINHKCRACLHEYQTDVVNAIGHDYVSRVEKVANCTENGSRVHTCEKCGDNYATEIPTMGHNYMITDSNIADGKSMRTYTCSVCADSYVQDLGNQYEHVTSYVEYLFNQYSSYMVWVLVATVGVWSIFIGVSIIIACKNEEKEKAKRMLINYGIGMVIIFAILVACPYLIRGIAILVS